MDPEESIASYARFLEKQTKMQMDTIAVCIENLEKRINEALGPGAKIEVYGKTPIEREENNGHITIKAAVKVDFHNDKTPSGVPIPDAIVTLFGENNVQFLPKQEGYLPDSFLTGKLEL
jgi:hypothetical protein